MSHKLWVISLNKKNAIEKLYSRLWTFDFIFLSFQFWEDFVPISLQSPHTQTTHTAKQTLLKSTFLTNHKLICYLKANFLKQFSSWKWTF